VNIALEVLSGANIYIDDTAGISIMEMKSKCRRLNAEKKLDLVIIDYLQLMNPEGRTLESRTQEISVISRNLKLLARELDCPVLVHSQPSRNPDQRTDHRPMLSDLRDSGSIEQDADIVVFLHRPGLLGLADDPDEQARTEVIFAKNRNGQVGSVDMRYVGHLMKFEDVQTTFYESAMNSEPVRTPARKEVAYQPQVVQQPYNPFDEFTQTDFNI
jgi:replicative DNA helicase